MSAPPKTIADTAGTLPLIVTPDNLGVLDTPDALASAAGAVVEANLPDIGGILFRGFGLRGKRDLADFARSFGHDLLTYEFGSTPRTDLGDKVYTSTEYPPHQRIPLHNEQAYTTAWPMKIWFHCETASPVGGETPIADSRRIYEGIDPDIRRRFAETRLRYLRNYIPGLDVPWQTVFGTEDPAEVDRYCRANDIETEWVDEDHLRTAQVCQGVARHPRTGADVWFNQAHLFHVSNMAPDIREALLAVVEDEANLPRHVTWGDGTPIEDGVLDHVRGVIDAETVSFPWQAGDVLMLDNMLVAHGRSTFEGERKVVVAMAEGHS